MQHALQFVVVEIGRRPGDMAEHVLALGALADLVEIVVTLVGENVLAQFQHGAVLQARARPPEAAASTALMMGSYPVQRQILPAIALTTSSREGDGLRSSKAFAAISMPGVQYPHCAAKCSMKARWSGCKFGPSLRPSSVSTERPSTLSASVRHARWASPSITNVQAPHPPRPQPNLGVISPMRSRNIISKLTPPSTKTATSRPLLRNCRAVLA